MTTTIRGNVATITEAADAAILGMRAQVESVQAQAARVHAARVQAQADVDEAVRALQDELSEFASFLADSAALIIRTNAHQYAGQTDPTIEPAAAPREAVEEGVVPVSTPKSPRKRPSKSKAGITDVVATGGGRVLVVAYGKGVRIVTEDGTYHDLTGTVDEYTVTFSSEGLTVFTDYPSWDARPAS